MRESGYVYLVNGAVCPNITAVQYEICGAANIDKRKRDRIAAAVALTQEGGNGLVVSNHKKFFITLKSAKEAKKEAKILKVSEPVVRRSIGTPLLRRLVTHRLGVYLGQRV